MADPIAPGMIESVPSFVKRYTDPAFNQLPPEVLNPIRQLDYNRVIRGSRPIPANRIPGIARAIQTGEAQAAKDTKGNIFERFVDDVGSLVRSVPQLPNMLINEVRELPQAPQKINEAIASGDLSKIAEAPGVRLLPGAFIAAEGRDALEHPLFAALDVAPYTKMGLARAAETAVGKTALEKVAQTADRFGVGPISRWAARTTAQGNRILAQSLDEYGKKINDLHAEYGIDEESRIRLTHIATRESRLIPTLPVKEQQYLKAVRAETERQGQKLIDAGLMGRYEGELYPLSDYNWFTSQQDRITQAIEAGDTKKAASLTKSFQNKYAKTPPLRFRPALLENYQARLKRLARSRIPEDNVELWENVSRDISEGFWDRAVPVVSRKELRQLPGEIAPNWIAMKESGLDPIFLHSVSPEQAQHLVRPTLYPLTEYTPSMAKAGVWNVRPGINDFAVGLGFAEYEYMRHVTTQGIIDTIESHPMWSKTKREIQDQHLPDVRARGTRPGMDVAAELQKRIDTDWVQWDPKSIFPTAAPRQMTGVDELAEPRYIPKAMADTLQKIYSSRKTEFAKSYDKVMKAFRTSILPMSPRWHVYNVLGGGVMLQARTGLDVWQFLPDAIRMVKENRLPVGLSRGFGDISEESRLWHWNVGRKVGKWADEREAFQRGARQVEEKTVGRAWKAAEFVDDMYRSMAYLYGKDKALTKGLGRAEQVEAGVKLSNKILQDWDSMVPFERQILRTVFPFYGWMRHIIQYAFTYPWDHPYRASIISNFARNEMDDWQTGLPEQFQNYLFFGNPDEYGNEKGFNIRGANPFADVANYFTLAGFLAQLNPIAGGLMEAAGINPISGKADLYPELYYDEETGRLEPKTPNAAMAVAESILPPLPLLRGALGVPSGEEKSIQLSDPQAYRSMLFSAAGIPFVPKTVNKPLEIARSELRRQDAMQDAWAAALRSGDFSEVLKYPVLRPLVEAYLAAAEAGQVDQLQLRPKPVGVVDPSELLRGLSG